MVKQETLLTLLPGLRSASCHTLLQRKLAKKSNNWSVLFPFSCFCTRTQPICLSFPFVSTIYSPSKWETDSRGGSTVFPLSLSKPWIHQWNIRQSTAAALCAPFYSLGGGGDTGKIPCEKAKNVPHPWKLPVFCFCNRAFESPCGVNCSFQKFEAPKMNDMTEVTRVICKRV